MSEPRRMESLNSFVERFQGAKEAQRTFPRNTQRSAMRYSQLRKSNKK